MQKYKAVIIDDEHSGRAVLNRLLQLYVPDVEVVAVASTIAAAREIIGAERPDIVFLDIRMNNESGFDLFENAGRPDFAVIFVTGHEEYAIPAIRAEAVDYLLKPVDVEELKQAIERARRRNVIPKNPQEWPQQTEGTLTIHHHAQVIMVQPEDVVYAAADRRYSQIYLSDGRNYTIPKTLSDLQQLWAARRRFCRISRSLLLNTRYIESYSKTAPCLIHVEGGLTFQVSRRKKTEILGLLENAMYPNKTKKS